VVSASCSASDPRRPQVSIASLISICRDKCNNDVHTPLSFRRNLAAV
jgi:hypothetical protein